MQNAACGGIAIEPEHRNDAYRSVVSDLVSLIDHVQASLMLIETAIAREISVGSPEISANFFVLDDVTPPCEGDGGVESLRCQSRHCPLFPARFQDPDAQQLRLCRGCAGAIDHQRIGG